MASASLGQGWAENPSWQIASNNAPGVLCSPWYEPPRTPRSLTVGVRRLYLPGGVMNQVAATKNRVVKA